MSENLGCGKRSMNNEEICGRGCLREYSSHNKGDIYYCIDCQKKKDNQSSEVKNEDKNISHLGRDSFLNNPQIFECNEVKPLTTSADNTSKGCGKRFMVELSNDSLAEVYCGYRDNLDELYLCPTCQATLKAYQECLEITKKFESDLKEDYAKNIGVLYEMFGYISVITGHPTLKKLALNLEKEIETLSQKYFHSQELNSKNKSK